MSHKIKLKLYFEVTKIWPINLLFLEMLLFLICLSLWIIIKPDLAKELCYSQPTPCPFKSVKPF